MSGRVSFSNEMVDFIEDTMKLVNSGSMVSANNPSVVLA